MIRALYDFNQPPTTNTVDQQEIDSNEQELINAYLQSPILTRMSIQLSNERAVYGLLNRAYNYIYPKVDEFTKKSLQPFFKKELQPDTAPNIIDYINILKSTFKNKSSFTEEFEKMYADNLARLERGETLPTPIDSYVSIYLSHQGSRTRQEMFDRATRTLELQEQINPKGFFRTTGEELTAGLLTMPLDPIASTLYLTSAAGVFKAFKSKTLRSIGIAAVEGGLKTVAERSLASIDSPDGRGFFEGAGTTFAVGAGGYLALGALGTGLSKTVKATRDLINKQLRGVNTVEKNVQNLDFDLEKAGYNEVVKDIHPAMEGKVASELSDVSYNERVDFIEGTMYKSSERLSASGAISDRGFKVTADGVGYEGEKLNADGRVGTSLFNKINKSVIETFKSKFTSSEEGLKSFALNITDIEPLAKSLQGEALGPLNVAIEDISKIKIKGSKTSVLSEFNKGFVKGGLLEKVLNSYNSGIPLQGEDAYLQPLVNGIRDVYNTIPRLYNQLGLPLYRLENKQMIIKYDRGTIAEISSSPQGKDIFIRDHIEALDWDKMVEREIELKVNKLKPEEETPEKIIEIEKKIIARYKGKSFRKSKVIALYEKKVDKELNVLPESIGKSPNTKPQTFFFRPDKFNDIADKYMGGEHFFGNFITDIKRQMEELAIYSQLGTKPIDTLNAMQKHFAPFAKNKWHKQILNYKNRFVLNSIDLPPRSQFFETFLAATSFLNGKILEAAALFTYIDDPIKVLTRASALKPNKGQFSLSSFGEGLVDNLFHKDMSAEQRAYLGVYLQDAPLGVGREFNSQTARSTKKASNWLYHNFFWKNDMLQRNKRAAGLAFDIVMKELVDDPKSWQSLTKKQREHYKFLGITEKDIDFLRKYRDKGMYKVQGAFGDAEYVGAKGVYNHFTEIGDTENALLARKILASQEKFRSWTVLEGSQIRETMRFGGRVPDQDFLQWVTSMSLLKRFARTPLNIFWQLQESSSNPWKAALNDLPISIITGMAILGVKQGLRGKNAFAVFFSDEFEDKSIVQKSSKTLSEVLRWYAVGGYGGLITDMLAMAASSALDEMSKDGATANKVFGKAGESLGISRTGANVANVAPAVAFGHNLSQGLLAGDIRKMARFIPGESFPLNLLVQRLLIDNYYANFTDEEEAIKRFQKEKEDAARRGQPYFDMLAPGSFTKLDMLEADEKNKKK